MRQQFTEHTQSLDLSFGLFPSYTLGVGADVQSNVKAVGATHDELLAALFDDFRSKQSQVTGKISKAHFQEDCLFDGPDPDMPVRGLAKYQSASTTLFQHKASKCELLAIGSMPLKGGQLAPVVFWRIEVSALWTRGLLRRPLLCVVLRMSICCCCV